MKKQLYIAYGSNLNLRQMEDRCPSAKIYGTGTLHNWTLDFRRMGSQAYATIHRHKGSQVPVLVWEIDYFAEQSLDLYEGYPNFYYKQNIIVSMDSGKRIKAMVYIMNALATPGNPSTAYVQTIQQGYLDNDLDIRYLECFCKSMFH